MDAEALVAVTLYGDHHVSFVQHKHADLLGIDVLVLGAPVEERARRSDHYLLLHSDSSLH